MIVKTPSPDTEPHPTYDLAVDLLAGLVIEAFRRDPEGWRRKAERRARVEAVATPTYAADLEAAEEAATDGEIRRALAARFGCAPEDVRRIR